MEPAYYDRNVVVLMPYDRGGIGIWQMMYPMGNRAALGALRQPSI